MTTSIRIALAQLNLCVGDLEGNLQKHIHAANEARDKYAANLIIFPELSLTGYPPKDLLLRPAFIASAQRILEQFISQTTGIDALVGHPYLDEKGLQNSCSLIRDRVCLGRYAKQCLPNYSVFDEYRYFVPGNHSYVAIINHLPIGFIICEDVWQTTPISQAIAAGAKLIVVTNASPFETDKHELRLAVLAKYAKQYRIPIIYVNHIGGQDEIIFDGGSMVINEEGNLCQFAGFYQERLLVVNLDVASTQAIEKNIIVPHQLERIYQGLVLSTHDYVEKNNFQRVLVGVSGGIDSALTLAIAVDALGKERVNAVMMPSRYSAAISLEDGISVAKKLGVKFDIISIEQVHQSFLETLMPHFAGKKPDVTEENIQSRCRGVLLMALSNKYHSLVLTTGNRSELAVGYCTIYGDMAGGFAVLKDIPKTFIYKLVNYRNQLSLVIPQRTIERPPTAELAPNQKDEDCLPPYSILDEILYQYLNRSQSIDEIVAQGFKRDMVTKIVNLIRINEYKRQQAAVGPRINYKSFGDDWRYPITNGFKG
ncbi:MAG: NAD+ synthase [Gammaproteobacteria bacterium RIFCSPHIGHO2_12_FULL_37_14]|nr:MAG: NAD+ synthase [Gammaproteobacteria bacterium RIFCSPHIGHO2_12_FULL_37_14]